MFLERGSRGLEQRCNDEDDQRGPFSQQILGIFLSYLQALGLPYDVINLRDVNSEACPAPINTFSAISEERGFTLFDRCYHHDQWTKQSTESID
jgi:hypothetical protein